MLTRQILQKSEEGINNSEFYMAIVTDNMLKDDKCISEWNYAKSKNKPFILLIKRGTNIPKEMLESVYVRLEYGWETEEDVELLSQKLIEFFRKNGI